MKSFKVRQLIHGIRLLEKMMSHRPEKSRQIILTPRWDASLEYRNLQGVPAIIKRCSNRH